MQVHAMTTTNLWPAFFHRVSTRVKRYACIKANNERSRGVVADVPIKRTTMILEILAHVEPTAAAAERWQRVAMQREAGNMRAHKVRSGENVVVVVNGDDDVATLLVRVQDADVATLDTPPRQVRIEFRVLQVHETEKLAAANGRRPWTCTLSGPLHP